jgi:hypothetical protein
MENRFLLGELEYLVFPVFLVLRVGLILELIHALVPLKLLTHLSLLK